MFATSFGRQVTINPTSFFYTHGKPQGLLYEQLEQLQRFVKGKFKTSLEVAEAVGKETVTYVDNIYKCYTAYKLATDRKLEVEKARAVRI